MSANQYLKRAVELAQGGDNKSALAEVKRALEIEPDHPKGLIFRFTLEARLLRRAQRQGDAAVRYRAVLALDPENGEAKKMLREHGTTDSLPARNTPTRELDAKTPSGSAHAGVSETGGPMGRTSDMPTMPPPPRAEQEHVHSRREPVRERPTPPTAKARPAQAPRKVPPPSDPPVVEVTAIGRLRSITSTGRAAARVSHAPTPAPRASAPQPLPQPEVTPSPMDDFEEPSFSDLPPASTETPLEPERRIASRVSIEVDVGISSESNFFTGFSGDISEGGLFIATYNVVPIGAHVEVAFGVLGHEVKADAVVCWIREPIDINLMPGFGVRFVNLAEADHSAIAEFIHARAPMFFDDE